MKILKKKYEQPLYKIKEFAEFVGLTVDTLLFYEKIKLFLPFEINPETKYRYYSMSQLSEISQIIQLKNLGLTLEEIKQMQKGNFTIEEKITTIKQKICSLQQLLQLYGVFCPTQTYCAYVKEIPQHYAFTHKAVVKQSEDILSEYEIVLNQLLQKKIKIKQPYHFYTKFYDEAFSFYNNNIEIFAELSHQHKEGRLIPKQKYICTLHYGDYKDLPKAYEFLFAYCKQCALQILDAPTEQYIESFGSKDNYTDFVTEIRLKIK